ncbi:hypothetical protein PFISCL1PPCAC_3598 [Pristionchus fissidentatus]|uniref:Active regulator of SIRT1 n=1 Tax=Pristionchus fissidentatus TaxID=1538716 RepID=A0AAV5UYF3_9BILA|nr:hypothetical protein PFISCL1PPCAC_3598 [Pristionchus fissidentatus]
MSEDLLNKFISEIEQEEGVADARRKAKETKRDTRRGQGALRREQAKIELKAASRGAVRLPKEQAYLEALPLERNEAKGVCLIDEARSRRAADNTERNMKYIKYANKLAITKDAVKTVVSHHNKSLVKSKQLRTARDQITCLREPKRDRNGKLLKKKSGSVFSEADFARLAKSSVNAKQMQAVKTTMSVFL